MQDLIAFLGSITKLVKTERISQNQIVVTEVWFSCLTVCLETTQQFLQYCDVLSDASCRHMAWTLHLARKRWWGQGGRGRSVSHCSCFQKTGNDACHGLLTISEEPHCTLAHLMPSPCSQKCLNFYPQIALSIPSAYLYFYIFFLFFCFNALIV